MPMRKLVGISAEQWVALDARRVATGVPVTVQVRQAVGAWLGAEQAAEPRQAPQPNASRQPSSKAAKLAKAKAALDGVMREVTPEDGSRPEVPTTPTPRGVNKGCARCTARCWARCRCQCHGDA